MTPCFHDVAEDIETAGNHLLFGQAQGIRGVHQGKSGVAGRIIPAGLDLLFFVGDDRAAVYFTAGACRRDDDTQRQGLKIHHARSGPEIIPDIAGIHSRHGNRLAAIDHRTAANAQNDVHLFFSGQGCPLLHFGIGGVGADAGKLHHGFACGGQNAHHLAVDSVGFDGAAAVSQQHPLATPQQAGQVFFDAPFAKIDLGGILKNEVLHRDRFLSRRSPVCAPAMPMALWQRTEPGPGDSAASAGIRPAEGLPAACAAGLYGCRGPVGRQTGPHLAGTPSILHEKTPFHIALQAKRLLL